MYLRVRDLAFAYPGAPILTGASFDVDRSEFVVLVGPNGAGKSTLIRLLTRVLRHSAGTVDLDGIPVESLQPAALARRVAVVPQDSPRDFDFSGFEFVLMGRTPHLKSMGRESKNDLEVVRCALEMTDSLHLAGRSIRQLSGGERQRLVVARALAQEPDLLLLDEPISHLDINHQADILGLVVRLCRERKIGALAVLHDLNMASAFADRLLVLHEGKIVAAGPPENVLTEARVRQVFGAAVRIIQHPVTGRPVVLLDRMMETGNDGREGGRPEG